MPTGDFIDLERFSRLPRSQRRYFLKYAGPDQALNWGAMAVYDLSRLSSSSCLDLLNRSLTLRRSWIMQSAVTNHCKVELIQRDLTITTQIAHPKFSCFYGPGSLLGILGQFETFYKVHGSDETVTTIVVSE